MKNSLLILFSLSVLISCTQESESVPNVLSNEVTIPNLEKLENAQELLFLEGKFDVQKSNDWIVIYTETKNKKHFFYLYDAQAEVDLKDLNAVAYIRHGLLLNNNILFGVRANMTKSILEDIDIIANKAIRLQEVQMLKHVWVDKGLSEYENLDITNRKFIEIQIDNIVQRSRECDAGGPGSTSCSISSGRLNCSVTCSNGSYSCCNRGAMGGVTCHCKGLPNWP